MTVVPGTAAGNAAVVGVVGEDGVPGDAGVSPGAVVTGGAAAGPSLPPPPPHAASIVAASNAAQIGFRLRLGKDALPPSAFFAPFVVNARALCSVPRI